MSQSPFALAAPTLIANGYSPLPVAPRCEPQFEGHRPPTGKEPGRLELQSDGDERWVRLRSWTIFCKKQVHPLILKHWSGMPDAGVCVCTGFGGLVAVDIDDDALVYPILEVLPGILVAKRGRKGRTAFFRTDWDAPSNNYRTVDKRGLLDFLSVGKQTVVPPTIHPDLDRPYEWLTPATLLTLPVADLPLFSREHHAEMERVLRDHGWGAPEPTVARSRAVVERPLRRAVATGGSGSRSADFWGAVNAKMAQWVPKLGLHRLERISNGWRSVASFRESGSGTPLGKRNQNLVIYDTGRIKDYAGKGYNAISLVAVCRFNGDNSAAYAWLCEEIGLHDAPAVALETPVAPTYPDNRVSIVEASKPLSDVFGEGFKDVVLAGRASRNQAKIKPPLIPPDFPVEIIPTETGIGKTHAAIEGLTPLTKLGLKFVYAAPNHDLANQVATDFRAAGASVEVFRSYERPDPRSKKYQMCRRPEEFRAVRALGIPTHSTICESKPDLVAIRCPHASRCGLMRQRKATPDIWIVCFSLQSPSSFPRSMQS